MLDTSTITIPRPAVIAFVLVCKGCKKDVWNKTVKSRQVLDVQSCLAELRYPSNSPAGLVVMA